MRPSFSLDCCVQTDTARIGGFKVQWIKVQWGYTQWYFKWNMELTEVLDKKKKLISLNNFNVTHTMYNIKLISYMISVSWLTLKEIIPGKYNTTQLHRLRQFLVHLFKSSPFFFELFTPSSASISNIWFFLRCLS